MGLVVLIQTSPLVAEPFFTNDLEGFVKIIFTFGAVIGALIFTLIKLSQSKATEEIKDFRRELDGYGSRLGDVEKSQEQAEGAMNELARTVSNHTLELGGIRETQGEVKTELRIIDTLVRSSSEKMMEAVKGVEVQLARLQERDRLADLMEKFIKTNGGNR